MLYDNVEKIVGILGRFLTIVSQLPIVVKANEKIPDSCSLLLVSIF